jgi:hypothetical protein
VATARAVTPGVKVGFARFAIPMVTGIALLGILGVLVVDDRWQQRLLSALPRH